MKGGKTSAPLAMRRKSRAASGYSLLECLVYITALGIIMELAFAAYYRIDLHHRRLARNAADLVRTLQAGERWREDVRSTIGKLEWRGTGADQELRIPQAKGEVAYAFRQGTVWRRTTPGGPWMELLPEVKTSRMVADPRKQVTAWQWELELQSTQKVVRVSPLFTFEASVPNRTKP